MRIVLAVALALLALPAPAASLPLGNGYGAIDADRDIDSVGLGLRFCEARLLDDMSRVDGHIAPVLALLIANRPPEQVPWQSVDVRPTGCSIDVVNGATDTIGVLLKVSYTAPGFAWSDTLNLLRTPDTWLITNVFYESGGNLRFRLFENR
jgi:hypothetical protein